MFLLAITGLPVVAELGVLAIRGVANGARKVATVFSNSQTRKILEKIMQNMEEEDEEQCRFCNQLTTIQEFWGQLPQSDGRYKASDEACFYKDKTGKTLKMFQRSTREGKQCVYLGNVCACCGQFKGYDKRHKHHISCPYT